MKKILYIDIWEKGYRNFLRIDPSLIHSGYTTLLLHTGSFYEQSSIKEHTLNNLLSRDISYYNTFLIRKALRKEKPDLVVMLNLSFIFDRAIVNMCKSMNIKLVYLSHGKLIAPEEVEQEAEKLNSTIRHNLGRVFRLKNLYVFLNYFSSLTGMDLIRKPIKMMMGVVRKPSGFLTFPKYDQELDADKMLVYTDEDKRLLSEHFQFPVHKIKVVGNPEISAFMETPDCSSDEYRKQLGLEDGEKYFVYLDDGLVCDRILTAAEWEESLTTLCKHTAEAGYRFVLKLHPRTDPNEFEALFSRFNFVVLRDCDFKNLLKHSEFVVSHLSTTILYALLFNKKVCIPYWGMFAGFARNYPDAVVRYCLSEADFLSEIKDNTPVDHAAIESYLTRNGINLKENALNNIVREITALLQ